MLLASSARAQPVVVAGGTRDATLWPFDSYSFINRPIGSGAVFTDDPTVRNSGPGFNSTSWTIPLAYDDPNDYLVAITQQTQCGQGGAFPATSARLPAGMTGSDPQTCYRDGFLAAIKGTSVLGFTRFVRKSNTTGTASYHKVITTADQLITGSGRQEVRGWPGGGHWIGGFSLIAGLIRHWEIDAIGAGTMSFMRHALMVTLSKGQLKRRPRDSNGNFTEPQDYTWTWPATWSDGNGGGYTGTVPMGALLAIPPSFNIEAQSWNASAKALARTLQKYGAYVMGQGGDALLFYAEEYASQPSVITQMKANLGAIMNQLRIVSNNGPTAVGGGGTYPPDLWPIPDPVMP